MQEMHNEVKQLLKQQKKKDLKLMCIEDGNE